MLRSLKATNPQTKFDIYIAHSSLTDKDFEQIQENINENIKIHKIVVDEKCFENAPVLSRISKETYYRMLLADFLPPEVDRILYLDPDIVIIKPLDELYNIDLEGNVLAGAPHTYGAMEYVNQKRLGLNKTTRYINAGVMLIDVNAWRDIITTQEIVEFVVQNIKRLKLSDQDAINILFEDKILYIDERKYNLDEKTYCYYSLKRNFNLDCVDESTIVVHFNGGSKPWHDKKYRGKLGGYFEKFR